MTKTYFHDAKHSNENISKKNITQTHKLKKRVVDINILLNRVKLEERNESKRKIIFFSLVTLALFLFGSFVTVIK
jgi:hypothetical protein